MTEGLQRVKSADFDLYLLNHHLQHGEEIELCDKLRQLAPNTPLLFYSTVTYPYQQRHAIQCGTGGSIELTNVSEVPTSAPSVIAHPCPHLFQIRRKPVRVSSVATIIEPSPGK